MTISEYLLTVEKINPCVNENNLHHIAINDKTYSIGKIIDAIFLFPSDDEQLELLQSTVINVGRRGDMLIFESEVD